VASREAQKPPGTNTSLLKQAEKLLTAVTTGTKIAVCISSDNATEYLDISRAWRAFSASSVTSEE
jgi:hypothetical protein